LKTTEKELAEKQKKIDSLEAQLVSLIEDIKFAEAKSRELEETNQLLKVLVILAKVT
jgi:multidrug resistance efflux pump